MHHLRKVNTCTKICVCSYKFNVFFVDTSATSNDGEMMDGSDEPRKKKYAKEAWPGRKPLLSSF